MEKIESRNISVNETNDFFIIEFSRGRFTLIPKKNCLKRKSRITNPMVVLIYDGGNSYLSKIYLKRNHHKKMLEDRVIFDANVVRRASFNKEMRLFLYKQKPFPGSMK